MKRIKLLFFLFVSNNIFNLIISCEHLFSKDINNCTRDMHAACLEKRILEFFKIDQKHNEQYYNYSNKRWGQIFKPIDWDPIFLEKPANPL